jgi:hypothetical protein
MIKLPNFSLCEALIYLLLTGAISLVIRVITSIWRSLESHEGSLVKFKAVFKGNGWKEDGGRVVAADYWQSYFLGWLELISYPILFTSGLPSFIGAWLAFKTVNRFKYNEVERGFFNRYLISNGVILICSYLMENWYLQQIST